MHTSIDVEANIPLLENVLWAHMHRGGAVNNGM